MNVFNLHSLELEGGENKPQNAEPIATDINVNELIVSFSAKLVDFLRSKAKEHNKNFPKKKVTLNKLKEVYKRGANAFGEEGKTPGECATARVNMFLRILADQNIPSSKKSAVASSREIDITESWSPISEDFAKASEEIRVNGLDYNFSDVNNLYLDEESVKTGFFFEV